MLTMKQSNFALALADGASQADAYRQAYKAKNMGNNSIYVEASRQASNPKVSLRLEELLREKDEDRRLQAIKREDFVLDGLAYEAETATSDSARVRALELLGKSIGLFIATADQDTEPKPASKEIEEQLASKLEEYFEGRRTSWPPIRARPENK